MDEKPKRAYDLEERTAKFGERVISLCASLKSSIIIAEIVRQLIRSATSVGANYMEANGASSKRDFINKIFICKKEAQETKYWLRMLRTCIPEKEPEIALLSKEAYELVLIFHTIGSSARKSV